MIYTCCLKFSKSQVYVRCIWMSDVFPLSLLYVIQRQHAGMYVTDISHPLNSARTKSPNANGHVCWFIDRPCHWRCCKFKLSAVDISYSGHVKHFWCSIRLVYMACGISLYFSRTHEIKHQPSNPHYFLKAPLCRLSLGEHWFATYVSWCWCIFLLHCLLRFRAAPRDPSSAPRGTFARRGWTIS